MAMDRMILGENVIYSTDSNETGLNNNVIVCGSSGCGKTMSISEPRLLETFNSSLIATVTKRRIVNKYRRLASNRLIDRLFNTNRVDHYVEHVPAWEPRFRKEEIHAMPPSVCLVKMNGEGYWVQV